jgi:ATP-dependent Clp protease adaptor protein ClpS
VASVADVGYIAIVMAGLGAYWWRHLRAARTPEVTTGVFAPDAEVALHVAVHEARSRKQPLASVHVLYGLLQDEAVTGAIATAGGDADALEDRVLVALAQEDARDDARGLLGHVATVARHADRQATCCDLWAALAGSRAARLLDDGQLDRGAVLFALFHGGRAPEVTLADHRDVFVVLRNDHVTTQQFVCDILREVFELAGSRAIEVMLETHTTGRGVIGRFTAAEARARIDEVRARARVHAFPLWIGVEPA